MTRIISGRLRGKRITGPKNETVRPTTDRAKEALFNILYNQFHFEKIKALDLFSGLGSLSLELSSRGCEQVTAVDGNAKLVKFLEETAQELRFEGLQAVCSEVVRFVERDYREYDLILADPPYDYQDYENLVTKIFSQNLLLENGLLVLEHQARSDMSHLTRFSHTRKYGNVAFSFFDLNQPENP